MSQPDAEKKPIVWRFETDEIPVLEGLKVFKEDVIDAIAASEARMTDNLVESEARMTRKIETAIGESEARMKDYVDKTVGRSEDRLKAYVDKSIKTAIEASEERMIKHMDDSFKKFGSRWGIFTEDLWRGTIRSVIEESFNGKVQERDINGEQFDIVINNGHHILIEMTARAKVNIVTKMTRKRQVYTDAVQAPHRVILATTSISFKRAKALEAQGIEVIDVESE